MYIASSTVRTRTSAACLASSRLLTACAHLSAAAPTEAGDAAAGLEPQGLPGPASAGAMARLRAAEPLRSPPDGGSCCRPIDGLRGGVLSPPACGARAAGDVAAAGLPEYRKARPGSPAAPLLLLASVLPVVFMHQTDYYRPCAARSVPTAQSQIDIG